ncbi:hypothetical protein WJX72_001229 [[Myrmecia] bisecta]|uniref:Uncharacterized protein n=1 Tax=[Myrmecia] bisecta TaxID=41462 RepID=A0AAW1QAY7_9CHLO
MVAAQRIPPCGERNRKTLAAIENEIGTTHRQGNARIQADTLIGAETKTASALMSTERASKERATDLTNADLRTGAVVRPGSGSGPGQQYQRKVEEYDYLVPRSGYYFEHDDRDVWQLPRGGRGRGGPGGGQITTPEPLDSPAQSMCTNLESFLAGI